jgi:hypothetical protein
VTRARGWTNRALPKLADAVLQLGLWVGAYYAYRLVRGIMDGQTAVAFDHARGIVEFERNIGLFFEPGLQHWVANHMTWLIDVCSWCYVNAHLIGTASFMVWLYVARRQAFPFVRNMFALMIGIPGARLTRTRWLRPLWYFYPMLVTLVVIVTANHFWIDAALGVLVAGLSFYGASEALARARPEVWSWRSRTQAEATI